MRKISTVSVIDSDAATGASLDRLAGGDSYKFEIHGDATAAVQRMTKLPLPDAALIAMRLPDASGPDCARDIKAIADIPIIFLADVADLPASDTYFFMYAEDFVVKPLQFEELDLRLRRALSQMPAHDYGGEPVLRVDKQLSVDFAHNRAIIAGKSIGLTPTESALLRILVRNAPRVVQSQTLLARVWPGADAYEDTLRVHMHRLRRKLETDAHHPHYIRTERGAGYRFAFSLPQFSAEDV